MTVYTKCYECKLLCKMTPADIAHYRLRNITTGVPCLACDGEAEILVKVSTKQLFDLTKE